MAGIHLNAGNCLSLLVILVAGAAAWAAIGTAVTALIPAAQGANPVLIFTYLPVILFSGGFGSMSSSLPHWLATLMSYLPGEPSSTRPSARWATPAAARARCPGGI